MQTVLRLLYPHSVLSPFSPTDVAEQAGSRELMSKAAELRQSISKTEQNLTEATKVCYILLYNFELWYNYATDKQEERLTKPVSQ